VNSNSNTTVTPETLSRHELAGLAVRVVATRVKQVPKDAATFEFRLPAGTEDASTVTVTVEGERLIERPARRTERGSDSKWR